MKKMIILFATTVIIVIVVIILVRTFTFPFLKADAIKDEIIISGTSEMAIRRLSEGIKIPTVSSYNYEETDFGTFNAFKAWLQSAYPGIYQNMETYTVNEYGLVFIWKGRNSRLDPILFLSHYDVVPAGDDSWDYPPFSGAIAKDRIYGRGTLDMKSMLCAILEAADDLIISGFTPERDIYIAFGHDEEAGGLQGASEIVKDFREKNLTFDAIYDEGGVMLRKGSFGLVNSDIALIGVAEKGYVSYRIKVKGQGGHSSMPPTPMQSALGQAAVIVQKLEDNQMKARIIQPVQKLLINIGGAMSFINRMAIANQWLFGPGIISSFSKEPSANTLIRTTTAVTMIKGSDAENVLPPVAEITVNFRILPGNTVEQVSRHVEELCKGFDVEMSKNEELEPSDISTDTTRGYNAMKNAILRIYPGTIVSPYISVVSTDANKYKYVSNNIYRFIPVKLNNDELSSIHDVNEYISIENYGKMIAYFKEIMRDFDAK